MPETQSKNLIRCNRERMRIVFIGAVEFSKKMLLKLMALNADIAGVITKEESKLNADFVNLVPLCEKNKIPYRYVADLNQPDVIEWVKNVEPDIVFCFGWSSLIKKEFLSIAPRGVIGFHPAALPQNRGRHPIVWALALGLEKTASTFFFMDEGADSGDILSQKEIVITDDDARTLYEKVTDTALAQLTDFLPRLESNTYNRMPQDHSLSNYWRKRTERDGEIDFRMTSRAIYNLVRALTRPYIGAHVDYMGKPIKVWRAKEAGFGPKNIEYGKVLDVKNKEITVKCYDGAVVLVEHEFEKLPQIGEYL